MADPQAGAPPTSIGSSSSRRLTAQEEEWVNQQVLPSLGRKLGHRDLSQLRQTQTVAHLLSHLSRRGSPEELAVLPDVGVGRGSPPQQTTTTPPRSLPLGAILPIMAAMADMKGFMSELSEVGPTGHRAKSPVFHGGRRAGRTRDKSLALLPKRSVILLGRLEPAASFSSRCQSNTAGQSSSSSSSSSSSHSFCHFLFTDATGSVPAMLAMPEPCPALLHRLVLFTKASYLCPHGGGKGYLELAWETCM